VNVRWEIYARSHQKAMNGRFAEADFSMRTQPAAHEKTYGFQRGTGAAEMVGF